MVCSKRIFLQSTWLPRVEFDEFGSLNGTLALPMIGTRRSFLGGSAAAFLALHARQVRSQFAATWGRYNEIVVIDALCFFGRGVPFARALEDAKASGVTAVNITLGTTERDGLFEKTIAGIGAWEARLAAHPAQLLKTRSARDIETAKGSERLGLIYGFQDPGVLEGKVDRLRCCTTLACALSSSHTTGAASLAMVAWSRRTAVSRRSAESSSSV